MHWYHIVLIVFSYLMLASISTGIIKRFNDRHRRNCGEDEYFFMFIFWPIVIIAKICIFVINIISDPQKYCKS